MRRSSQMRRKTMRSIVRWTAKLRSRCESAGLRKARLPARSARHFSISSRNASSTSAVPRLALVDSANLKRRVRIAFDVHRWLFRLEKKFARATDAKAIVRRFRRPANLNGVFMDDVFVGFGVTTDIFHVPSERLEHRIDKFLTQLSLVILA